MLEHAGFGEIKIQGDYSDEPATADHEVLIFVASSLSEKCSGVEASAGIGQIQPAKASTPALPGLSKNLLRQTARKSSIPVSRIP